MHKNQFEVPPTFYGYVLDNASGADGVAFLGLATASGPAWDVWNWSPTQAAPPKDFQLGGVTEKVLTRAQVFAGTVGSISPTVKADETGYVIWYQGIKVGYVAFEILNNRAQWWMYQTSHTAPPFFPTPTAQYPLSFSREPAPSSATGWKGYDYST